MRDNAALSHASYVRPRSVLPVDLLRVLRGGAGSDANKDTNHDR